MKRNRLDNYTVFLIISLSGTLLFLLVLLITGGNGAAWLAMENNFDNFLTDHFRHIAFASDMQHFYFNTMDATFPPFAYLFYYLLYRINPHAWRVNEWEECRDYQYNPLTYLILAILVVLLFRFLVDKLLPQYSKGKNDLFVTAVVLSAPMMAGALERGNISFLTAVMLIAALYLKDSDKAWKREAALLLIAAASGLKLYPAIFGVIYIVEKRYKEGIRLLIYGLLVFLVPFIFCGGIPGLIQYIKILFFFENQGYRSWTNVRNYLLCLSDLLGQYEKSASFVKYFKLAENFYLFFCVISMFKTREKWKYVLYTSGIMAIYVPFSYRYTSVYMLIPLVIYLAQDKVKQKKIYSVLFALIFTVPVYGMLTSLEADFFIFTPIYIMMIYSFVEDWIVERKGKTTGQAPA